MSSFTDRMIRAAKLDVNLYEEVEADTGATGQAMAVVVLSSIAGGIGGGQGHIVMGTVVALIGWFLWALVTYLIGTKILPQAQTQADLGQLLRTIGFSSSPGLIRLLGIIGPLRGLVLFVASIWMLVAMIIAVRQALDYDNTGRAVAVCVIGWLFYLLLSMLIIGMM